MNYFKSIAVSVIAIFLFIGTIGVSVYSNFCEEEGVKVSYFAPNENFCCEEYNNGDECNDCCETQEDNDGCCDSSAELVKVHLDYLNQWVAKAILIAPSDVVPVWIEESTLIDTDILATSGTDPPPKSRQDILLDIQSWLI